MRRVSVVLGLLASTAVLLLSPSGAEAQPTLACSASGGGEVISGETVDVVVTIDNSGSAVGYVPGVLLPLPPGVSVSAATSDVLGASVQTRTLNSSGNGTHPANGTSFTGGPASGSLAFVSPGVNSLAPSAQTITFTISLEVDDTVTPYVLQAIAPACQFAFGADPVNNAGADAPLSTDLATSVTPVLMDLTHAVLGKASSAATTSGPSWPVVWTATINVAEGVELTSADFAFDVPENFEVTAAVVVSGDATLGAIPGSVGGEISGTLNALTGAASSADVVIEVRGFVPEFDSGGAAVINATTGAPVGVTANASVSDVVLAAAGPAIPDFDEDQSIRAHAFLLVESLANASTPGANFCPEDNLTLTAEICASDYFSFNNVSVVTLSPAGTTFSSSTGTTTNAPPNVTTSFGTLAAGATASVDLTFTVNELYSAGVPVLGGDRLDFVQELRGNIVGGGPLSVLEDAVRNVSALIKEPVVTKAITRLRGAAYVPGTPVNPGDVVTFQITASFDSGDQASFTLTDYLPPKFDALEHGALGGALTGAGPVRLAAGHSGSLPPVTATASGPDNGITFTMGAFSVPTASAPLTFQVEIDVTLNTTPVEDGFTLQNVVQASTGGSSRVIGDIASESIEVGEPFVVLSHGAIQVTNDMGAAVTGVFSGGTGPAVPMTLTTLDASPLTANVTANATSLPDAGDTVRWRVIAANRGRFPAHGVEIEDAFAATHFFGTPTILSITDGDGAALTAGVDYTDNTAAGQIFDITLRDPLPPASAADGQGIVVITYEATLQAGVDARHDNRTNAEIPFYTSSAVATTNYAAIHSESAVSRLARSRDFLIAKALAAGAPSSLAIRDQSRYRVTWTIPEGTHDTVTLQDRLSAGIAVVGSPTVTTSLGDVTVGGATTASVTATGSVITVSLGDVINANRDNATPETVSIEYDVVATNVAANERGDRPSNAAVTTYRNNPPSTGTRTVTRTATPLVIEEPRLSLMASTSPGLARPGDTVTLEVTVSHHPASDSDAHDADYTFTLPAELENLVVTDAPSLAPSSMTVTSTSAAYTWDDIALAAADITFTMTAQVRAAVTPIETANLTQRLTWTSHPVDDPAARAVAGNASSVERTGAGGVNGYAINASPSVQIRECLTGSAATDCNDGIVCTADSCSAAGLCVNTPIAAGASCTGGAGVCTGAAGTPANTCEACIDDNSSPTDNDSQCAGAGQCDTSGGTGMHMCVSCLDTAAAAGQDDGCASAVPVCDTSVAGGSCVECTLTSHCAADERCSANACVPASCGDGVVDIGETCDEGDDNGPDGTCSDACVWNVGSGPCTTNAECSGSAVCSDDGICETDSDGDGVQDTLDPDDDNDGIPDITEGQGTDPSLDSDGDSILDFEDEDTDGFVDENMDGLDDRYDFDGDGVPNHLDLDADNDGISDATEGGATDADGDGIPDGCVDDDDNGVCDSVDDEALPVPNTDMDGGPDFLDLDSDSDGITDASESGAEDLDGNGIPDSFADVDMDGVSDVGLTEMPTDTDGMGVPDYQQIDSDGDGIDDNIEGHDDDMDGAADVMASGVDTDMDGIDDAFDPDCTMDAPCGDVIGVFAPEPDADMDGIPDYQDLDSDGDGIPDAIECGTAGPPMCSDSDMDGTPDYLESDSDNDGVPDNSEAYDLDGDGTPEFMPVVPVGVDTDGDGIDDAYDGDCMEAADCLGVIGTPPTLPDSDMDMMPDYQDTDDDNDGIPSATEVMDVATLGGEPDDDGVPAYLDLDSDGDGASDTSEGAMDPTTDIDDDGVPDYLDADAVVQDTDGDGIPDHLECPDGDYVNDPDSCRDSDGDGQPDFDDADDDNDGILTVDELVADMSDGNDFDMDGVPSHLDLDSDNDGIPDVVEAGGDDADFDGQIDDCTDADPEDGVCDGIALMPPNTDGTPDGSDPYDTDADNDGIPDTTEALDQDGDGEADVMLSGTDTDGDGIDDAFDTDEGAMLMAPPDTDMDGIPDFQDIDSDGDGIVDTIECGPLAPDCVDTDADGTPDYLDLDSDGDGIVDATEGHDANMDGVPDAVASGMDSDGDGLDDAFDPDDGGTMAPTQDSDGDGRPDYQDIDSDGDGLTDSFECETPGTCPDTDEDGTPDYLDLDSDGDSIPDNTEVFDTDGDGMSDVPPSGTDTDGDGLDDAFDPDNGGTEPPTVDTDGDEIPNFRDNDDDGDDILTADEPTDADGSGVVDYLEPLTVADPLGGYSGGSCAAGGTSGPGWLAGLFGLALFARRRRRR